MGTNMITSSKMIFQFLRRILPLVNQEVNYWQAFASENIPDQELKSQALSSIQHKRFHCLGGSFYSLYPGVNTKEIIPFIVALQTISDYLDNLCDRTASLNQIAFAQLHLAFTDALDPDASPKDYYAYYPYKNDGGYLRQLVSVSQSSLCKLPSYHIVKKDLLTFGTLYSQLQTYKHIALDKREAAMLSWIHSANKPSALTPWEFAAATGSTLGMFMLVAAAYRDGLTEEEVQTITDAYFPWICGLHIQLDYFIDQAEDRENNDLNFISYYENDTETAVRLNLFYDRAFQQSAQMPNAFFPETIVRGLAALYLSDEKVSTAAQQAIRSTLLNRAGTFTSLIYHLCRLLRKKHIL